MPAAGPVGLQKRRGDGTKLKSLDLSRNRKLDYPDARGKDVNSSLSTVSVWAGFKATDHRGWKVPDGTVFREKN